MLLKHGLALATSSLFLMSCATAGKSCISKSEAGNQPINFGSVAASSAYSNLPKAGTNRDKQAEANEIVEMTTKALSDFELPPEAETKFLRRRLSSYEVLKNISGARADTERLITLDRLNRNEAPYLMRRVEQMTSFTSKHFDRDAQPLIRIPPRIPPRAIDANISGHCVLHFDVSPDGRPENIEVGYCTNEVFRKSSTDTLAQWKYNPAIRNGKAVPRKAVKTTIRYSIQDACGNILPE